MTITSFDSITFDHFSIDPAPLGDGEQTISGQITVEFTYNKLIDPVTRENDPMHLYGYRLAVYGSNESTPDRVSKTEQVTHVVDFQRTRSRLDCGTIFNRRSCRFVTETTPLLRFLQVPVLISDQIPERNRYRVQSELISMGVDTSLLDTVPAERMEFAGGPSGRPFVFSSNREERIFLFAEVVSSASLRPHLSEFSMAKQGTFESAAA